MHFVGQCLANFAPFLGSVEGDLPREYLIFLVRPFGILVFFGLGAHKLLVAIVALDHGLEEKFADAVPVRAVHLHTLKELEVLSLIEMPLVFLHILVLLNYLV